MIPRIKWKIISFLQSVRVQKIAICKGGLAKIEPGIYVIFLIERQ